MAHDDSGIVGFVAVTEDSVGQLYVRVDRIGRGIGSALLQLAQEQSSGHLWLDTFARDHRAISPPGIRATAQPAEPPRSAAAAQSGPTRAIGGAMPRLLTSPRHVTIVDLESLARAARWSGIPGARRVLPGWLRYSAAAPALAGKLK